MHHHQRTENPRRTGSCTTSGIAVATYRRTVLRMRTWVPAAGSWFRIVPSASLLGCSTTLTTRFWRCRSAVPSLTCQTCHGGNGNHVVSLGARNIHVYGAAALLPFRRRRVRYTQRCLRQRSRPPHICLQPEGRYPVRSFWLIAYICFYIRHSDPLGAKAYLQGHFLACLYSAALL